MKYPILILICMFFLSCGTSNFVSTPDDVYFSSFIAHNGSDGNYVDLNDRYLQMKSRSNRWRIFDNDFNYWNSPTNGWYSSSPFVFSPWNSYPNLYWRNPNLFAINSYRIINYSTNPRYKPNSSNIRTLNNGRSSSPNGTFHITPRQYNLRTFDGNIQSPNIPSGKLNSSGSAPIRSFKQ